MKSRNHVVTICFGVLALAPALATAQTDAEAPAAEPAPGDGEENDFLYESGGIAEVGVVAGLKAGGGFSQVFSDLGTSPVVELELGYLLPPLDRSLQIFASGQYAQPKSEQSGIVDTFGPDGGSRLPGEMSYELTQQQAIITLGLMYRIPLQIPLFRPYLGAGGRAYLMKTKITGEAGGMPFGENEETATEFGAFGALGGELHLGPGAVLLELQVGWAKIDGFVMRNTSAGALNVALGYRLFI